MTKTFKTTLRCRACEAKIKPLLDADPTIESWRVDLQNPDKLLTVAGNAIDSKHVEALLESVGYQTLGEAVPVMEESMLEEAKASYFPLALVVAYITGFVGVVEWAAGAFDAGRAMANFMVGFFLVFSFFKLLDVQAFADGFATYDVLAARSRAYALTYPFVELGLGVAYLVRFAPSATNLATLVLMLFGTVGVAKALADRRKIRCACLGTVFNLPMSTVTLVEDLSMAAMAAAMLAWPASH